MPNIRTEVRIKPARKGILRYTRKTITAATRTYEFDAVHTTTSQQELFECSVRPLADLFMQGYDCSVIAYGQTGSGKTHTIGISPKSCDAMVQRTLSYLFSLNHRPSCSFIEIYNEEIIDLLLDERIPLNLRATGGPHSRLSACIVGLTEAPLDSLESALGLLRLGCSNRTTKSTQMNSESSRSHAVYTLKLPQGCSFSFVDLAGSERLKRTLCRGVAARESISINTGLLALGNVISALYLNKKHVPFRDSKLTRILEPCLSSHLLFIACVSPLQEDLNETANTLKYAGRAARISVEARPKVVEDKSKAEIVRLEREISRLREENNRLRNKLYHGNNINIRGHPYVQKLENLIKNLETELGKESASGKIELCCMERGCDREEQDVRNKDGDERDAGCPAVAGHNEYGDHANSIEHNGKHGQLKKDNKAQSKGLDSRHNNTQTDTQRHKRIVSFNLEPNPKRSFFTPRKESMQVFPVFSVRLPHITTAVCAASGALVACLSEGTVISLDEREKKLFEEQNISHCVYSDEFGLFYSVGSLLKVFSAGSRPIPVYACSSVITALSVSNSTVLMGHSDGSLSLFDLTGNSLLFSERLHSGAILGISKIGQVLFTGSRDHSIRYSSLTAPDSSSTSPKLNILKDALLSPPHYDSVSCLLNYKDMLVSLSRDCSVKTWQGTKPYKTVAGAHSSWIKCGAVAERCWVSGCRDGELRCWDLMDGSVRCVGKADVNQSVERMAVVNEDVWVCGRKEILKYKFT